MLDFEVRDIKDTNILYNMITKGYEYHSIHWYLSNSSSPAFNLSLITKLVENGFLCVDEISEDYKVWSDDEETPTSFRVMIRELAEYWNTYDLKEIQVYVENL